MGKRRTGLDAYCRLDVWALSPGRTPRGRDGDDHFFGEWHGGCLGSPGPWLVPRGPPGLELRFMHSRSLLLGLVFQTWLAPAVWMMAVVRRRVWSHGSRVLDTAGAGVVPLGVLLGILVLGGTWIVLSLLTVMTLTGAGSSLPSLVLSILHRALHLQGCVGSVPIGRKWLQISRLQFFFLN